MTDKEIRWKLQQARNRGFCSAFYAKTNKPNGARMFAEEAVHIIHHIINSINWED